MDAEQSQALRKPFPPGVVGKLPKGGMMLDYVGHAAITDRLLEVDPAWSWEPLALTPEGLPQLDRVGNLWIRLTICGVTRIGVGDGKNAKELIGDALRNAAMRFGVALDLWSKDELESTLDQPEKRNLPKAPKRQPEPEPSADAGELMSAKTRGQLFALFNEHRIPESAQRAGIAAVLGHAVGSRGDLTEAQARQVIASLRSRPKPPPAADPDGPLIPSKEQ